MTHPEHPHADLGLSVSKTEKTAARHTSPPWTVIDSIVVVLPETHGYGTWLANCSVGGESRETMVANAEFIVRAVNHHEELVAALRWAMLAGRLDYASRTSTNGDYCDGVDRARGLLGKLGSKA